jgi:hypothetical protein
VNIEEAIKRINEIDVIQNKRDPSTILHNFVDAHNKAISEVKQAIQKSKEAYL